MNDSHQIYLLLFAILILAAVFFYRAFILPLIRENAFKGQFQNLAEPVMIVQGHEGDRDFWLRVQRERQRFIDSGNRYAERQNPVIAIPYDSPFTIEWFGKTYHYSTVGLGRREYWRQATVIYDLLYSVWITEAFDGLADNQVFETVKNQNAFDRTKTWEFNDIPKDERNV